MTATRSVSPAGPGFRLTIRIAHLVVALIFAGCSGAGDIQRRVAWEVKQVIINEIRTTHEPCGRTDTPAKKELPISEALKLSLLHDPQLKSLRLTHQKSQIDIDQAKSFAWPRFTADASAQVPFDASDWETKSGVSAGIFLRYDIMQAIFSGDLAAVETARQKRSEELIVLEEKKVYYRLMRLLCRADYHMEAVVSLGKALDAVLRDRRLLDEARRPGAEFQKQFEALDAGTDTLTLELSEHQERRGSTGRTLQRMLAVPEGCEIEIAGFREQFPDPGNFETGSFYGQENLSGALRKRNDLRMMEMDFFIAEMGILSAKRGMLPRFGASLGLGHILLDPHGDSATLVPSIAVSVPLLDMGDVKRQVRRAEIERDSARMQLAAMARSIMENLKEKALQAELAARRLDNGRMQLEKASRRTEDLENLAGLGRTSLGDVCLSRIDRTRVKLRWLRGQLEFREAYLDLREALGATLEEDSIVGEEH